MKPTKFIFSMFLNALLALVLVSAVASAAFPCASSNNVQVCVTNTIPSTIAAGASVPIAFNVTYTGTGTDQTVTFTSSATNLGSWQLPAGTTIDADQSMNFNANLTAPSTGVSGSAINAFLRVNVQNNPQVEVDLPSITLNVPSSTLGFSNVPTVFIGKNDTFTLVNNGNTNLNAVSLRTTSVGGAFNLQFTPVSGISVPANGGTRTVAVLATSTGTNLRFGPYTAIVEAADASQNIVSTHQFTVAKSFCQSGPAGINLSITDVDFDSDGDEDTEWKRLDTIQVDVDVDNIGDTDIDDVIVEIALFDATGANAIDDMDFHTSDEEEVDLGDIDESDDDTATFEFTVPADFDAGDYKFAVKAYADGKQNLVCADSASSLNNGFYQSINIDRETDDDRQVVIANIQHQNEATCGDTVSGTFEVVNVGDDDQDRVRITLTNRELGLDEDFEILEDLDEGDDQTLDFSFEVPSSARDGAYQLQFRTLYNYDNGVYEDEHEDTFTSLIRVIGCGAGTPSGAVPVRITASLASEANAGESLVVNAVIRNEGTEQLSFSLDALGFQSWATLESISDRTLTLDAGESEAVTFSFNVNDDASGSESFIIEVASGSDLETQEVEVNIEGTQGATPFLSLGNPLLWVIGIINVVLIVLIIIVAVRVSRR